MIDDPRFVLESIGLVFDPSGLGIGDSIREESADFLGVERQFGEVFVGGRRFASVDPKRDFELDEFEREFGSIRFVDFGDERFDARASAVAPFGLEAVEGRGEVNGRFSSNFATLPAFDVFHRIDLPNVDSMDDDRNRSALAEQGRGAIAARASSISLDGDR
jgi:hypothetical protein